MFDSGFLKFTPKRKEVVIICHHSVKKY